VNLFDMLVLSVDWKQIATTVGFAALAALTAWAYLDLTGDVAEVRDRIEGHIAWHAEQDRGGSVPPEAPPPRIARPAEPTFEPLPPLEPSPPVPEAAELPDAPDRADILDAFRSAEPDVHACAGSSVGVTTVSVTVAGATGRVESARITDRFGGTPIGDCISAAIKRVPFPRSRRPRFLVTYPYWLRGHGGAHAEGALDRSALVAVVNAHRDTLQSCYDRAVDDADDAEPSRVDVAITISESGVVTTAVVDGDDVRNLRDCINRAVRRWQFPTAGGSTRATFPVILRPR
jgi:hypothetical protein